ncbi:trypsin-like peptidase domain-containing protein [Candidatus Saccharibacteria bacterium]|nr:trypsin-like peptidase domain-containing protein [Candidatus Saccharibacteria bacterium]
MDSKQIHETDELKSPIANRVNISPVRDEPNIKALHSTKAHKKQRRSFISRVKGAQYGLLVLLAVSAGFGGGYLGARAQYGTGGSITTEVRQQIVSSEGELISEIAKQVGPSVVSISVKTISTQRGFFGTEKSESEGAGTGVIINEDGTILTNRHVVSEDTTSVSVTLSDGTILDDVDVIGRTAENDPLDIAFLKIQDTKGTKLTVAKIGDSSESEVGDRVIAIGNALGQFQNTVTSGILSGYGRDIEATDGTSSESLQNLFQTDAAINPGNSGGPLMNLSGEVIGINVAVADANNIGFAIPINDVKGLMASVEKNGKLERPYLGVRYVSLTDDVAYYYNLSTKRGAYIAPSQDGNSSIISGSPAEKAGLKEKDIIVSINGTDIDEKNSLVSVLGKFSVGDTVEVKIVRDGKEQTLKMKLEAAPES